jgi:hypothetical protein
MPEIINENGNYYKNVTLNNLIDLFAEISAANVGIKSHSFGDIWEIDVTERNYAVSHLSIENAQYLANEIQYDFKLYVMDLVSKDEGNENDVLSDTLQIIGDFVSVLQNSRTINIDTNTDYRLQEGITCQPFTERFDDDVSGWVADISIRVFFDYSACQFQIM